MPNIKSSPYILKAEQLETQQNKTLVVDKNSTDKQYPSAKAVYNALVGGVGKETAEGGEIFNDIGTNKSLNTYSHTEGTENTSSTMGFKILNMTEEGLAMRLEGDASKLLDPSIITNRDERGLENSTSFQWSQNFDLCCNVTAAEYQNSTNTTNVQHQVGSGYLQILK